MNLADSWRYPHGDPSVHLFTEAVQRWPLDVPINGTVVELGCCETDFSKWLREARPDVTLIGVDVNPCEGYGGEFLMAPAESIEWERHRIDAVIALGSLEHFGLGFYGDPVDEDADCITVANVAEALKPGGWVYYDVPWTPDAGYVTENRHFRVYDDGQLAGRVTAGLVETHRAYAHGHTDVWQETRPEAPTVPFWYVIRRLVKES